MNKRLLIGLTAFIAFSIAGAPASTNETKQADDATYWNATELGIQKTAPSSAELTKTPSMQRFNRRAEDFSKFIERDEKFFEAVKVAELAAVSEDVAIDKDAFAEFADAALSLTLKKPEQLVFLTMVRDFTCDDLREHGVIYTGEPFLFFCFGGKKTTKLSQPQIENWARFYLTEEVKVLVFHDETLSSEMVGYVVAGDGACKSGAVNVNAIQNDAEELEKRWRPSPNIKNDGVFRAIIVGGGGEDPREKKPVASDKRDRRIIAAERVCFLASLAFPEYCNELRRKARINTLNKKIRYK